ncbi:hypothetical protein NXS19_013617 [Fusarium pseudograminearum]|nr:hypothetical protein NXS19_013617 [Fusarium pseudograminearum]
MGRRLSQYLPKTNPTEYCTRQVDDVVHQSMSHKCGRRRYEAPSDPLFITGYLFYHARESGILIRPLLRCIIPPPPPHL